MTRQHKIWFGALLFVLVVRAVSLPTYPLTDTTEARYGEVARVMADSGNWVTPQLVPGEPFWAKPPLSFWQGAASVSIFGVSELSLRLPALINMLLVITFVYFFTLRVIGRFEAVVSAFVVSTTVVGFITAGSVMTDSAMLISTTLVMVSFWFALRTQDHQRWSYVFFIAIALGFLAKGPVALVMAGVPIVLWTTIESRWKTVFNRIAILEGTAVFCLIALPWFLLAEIKTPGFLEYFFIGEHLQRYLDSGWTGDRYGTAHDEPRGTIWLFALAAFFPWSIIILGWILKHCFKKPLRIVERIRALSSLERYILLWCLWPMLFFSFAGNILPTYVLTGLPAFSMLLAITLGQTKRHYAFILAGLLLPIIVCLAGPLGILDRLENRSQSALITTVYQKYPDTPILYLGKAPHSARFYSKGTAFFVSDVQSLRAQLPLLNDAVIVSPKGMLLDLSLEPDSLTVFAEHAKHIAYRYERDDTLLP